MSYMKPFVRREKCSQWNVLFPESTVSPDMFYSWREIYKITHLFMERINILTATFYFLFMLLIEIFCSQYCLDPL